MSVKSFGVSKFESTAEDFMSVCCRSVCLVNLNLSIVSLRLDARRVDRFLTHTTHPHLRDMVQRCVFHTFLSSGVSILTCVQSPWDLCQGADSRHFALLTCQPNRVPEIKVQCRFPPPMLTVNHHDPISRFDGNCWISSIIVSGLFHLRFSCSLASHFPKDTSVFHLHLGHVLFMPTLRWLMFFQGNTHGMVPIHSLVGYP